MISLIQNETIKILRRRRFMIVVGILFVIMTLVSYSQYRQLRESRNENWRAELQERIARYENRLRRGRMNESWSRSMKAEVRRMQFYLDRDINPEQPTAPLVVRSFANAAGFLLLPLLIGVLGSDIVSAENAEGTDKLLLTRPVRRWKILTSKLITLWMFATLTLLAGAILSYVVSAPVLPARGWDAPMFNGFQFTGETLKVDAVRELPLWKDALIAYGLEWYALLAVAAIALLLSVLFKSSAASIGTMLASLIGGTILTRISPDWTAGKYLFVSALPLAEYYSGQAPPYDGMSMGFCIALLGIWALAAITAAYTIFTRRDVFG
ncbi:MAG: ABC transporter permease subunit [Thermoanaerobaculia bacterium]|nr:ABC transporter permease subunit [Thermoanaerobaculia bacterium]